jgi:hypothetical protein
MTFEDFVESVAAGWVPIAWKGVVFTAAQAAKWIVLQVAIAALFRVRK